VIWAVTGLSGITRFLDAVESVGTDLRMTVPFDVFDRCRSLAPVGGQSLCEIGNGGPVSHHVVRLRGVSIGR
jgi:hypothetical protein